MPQVTRVSRFGFVNAYLVDEDDGLTVIDTMLPKSGKVVLAKADELGRPIVRIALTHAHGDHIGSLDELAAQLPDAEVLISARDARLLAGDKSLDPGEPEDKLRGSYPGAKTTPGRTLVPGDRVGSLEVVAAPGHTPGHIAFLDTRDRTLYCGDAYTTLGGVDHSRVQLALPAGDDGDLAQADGARDGEGAARTRSGTTGPGSRQGGRVSGGSDGPRNLKGEQNLKTGSDPVFKELPSPVGTAC